MMPRRSFVLLVVLILAATTAALARALDPVKGTAFLSSIVPNQPVKPGSGWAYEFSVSNVGNHMAASVLVDIVLPKQKIDVKSIRVDGMTFRAAKATLIGNHLRWTARNIRPRIGYPINLTAHVLQSATGKICNRLKITYEGIVGDFSPPCVPVSPAP